MPNLFGPESINKIISETLPDLKPGINNVVVGTVDKSGAQVVASFQRTQGPVQWQLQAVARHEWSGDSSAAAKVMLQW